MGLKTIVSALLPWDYREQVLGDLEERGFPLTDIASVIPRVWASYFVRTLTAPAPPTGCASEAAILARTWQLARQGAFAFYGANVLTWVGYLAFVRGVSYGPVLVIGMSLVTALVAIPGYFAFVRRALPDPVSLDQSGPRLMSGYRRQIDYQVTQAKGMLYMPPAIVVLWLFNWYDASHLPKFLLFLLPMSLGVAIVAERRIFRLRRELNSLDLA